MADPFQQVKITIFNPVTKDMKELITDNLLSFCVDYQLSFSKVTKQIKECNKKKRAFVVSVSCDKTYSFEYM